MCSSGCAGRVSGCLCPLKCVVLLGFSFVVLIGYVACFYLLVLLVFSSKGILDEPETESSLIKQQDRQCTINLTFKRVRLTTVAIEKQ